MIFIRKSNHIIRIILSDFRKDAFLSLVITRFNQYSCRIRSFSLMTSTFKLFFFLMMMQIRYHTPLIRTN